MLLIKLIDARRGLHNKCDELFSDQKIAEEIYRKLCDGIEDCETVEAEPKRDFEVVVNEACLNCELDCVEVVRCHDCSNYEETKNGCNGFCKEWNTSTYSWEWCSRGTKMDGRDNG